MAEKLKEKIKNTINEHALIERGEAVVLGLSGGPDSLALFDVLYGLREELGFSLCAVHVNHKLRPGAAEEDRAFVEALCRERGIPCDVYVYDCAAYAAEHGLTSEEAGRELRYDSFAETAIRLRGVSCDPEWKCHAETHTQDLNKESTAKSGGGRSVRVAVAHNSNDQAETVLFRLIRGTGTDGLSGMEYERRDERGYTVIRPLLDCSREEIEAYCEKRGLKPRIDLTNSEVLYMRNKVRLELLPALREYNNNIEDAIIRLASTAAEDKAFIWEEARRFFSLRAEFRYEDGRKLGDEEVADILEGRTAMASAPDMSTASGAERQLSSVPTEISLPLGELRELPAAVRHRVVLLAFEKIGLAKDIGRKHLLAADELLADGGTGKGVDFPRGYRAEISYDRVLLLTPPPPSAVPLPGLAPLKGEPAAARSLTEGFCEGLDATDDLTWRTRQPGDFIRVRLSKAGEEPERWGRKKIQDYMVDRKIPRGERDRILLLCRGHEVLKVGRPPENVEAERPI